MFHSKGIFVVLLLALNQLVSAGSHTYQNRYDGTLKKRSTNAARMAAGLGPLPPAHLQARTGGGHGNPGHGNPGHGNPGHGNPGHGNPKPPTPPSPPKPGPSTHPGKPPCDDKHNVPIKCHKKGGGHVGYVSKNYSTKNKKGYGLCTQKRDALLVDFNNEVTPFDARISNDKSAFPFLGFSGNNLSPGQSSVLTGTAKTPAHAGPQNVGNRYSSWSANSESQIWSYTRDSKKIIPQWVNSGGAKPQTTTVYNPDDDLFHITTDFAAFKRKFPRSFEVELEIDD